MDLGVDRGLGYRADSRRSRYGFVSPETGMGGAHVPGCYRRTLRDFLTQVPQRELDRGVPVEGMTHEPLGFLSGTFEGSQQRWATVDKEGLTWHHVVSYLAILV